MDSPADDGWIARAISQLNKAPTSRRNDVAQSLAEFCVRVPTGPEGEDFERFHTERMDDISIGASMAEDRLVVAAQRDVASLLVEHLDKFPVTWWKYRSGNLFPGPIPTDEIPSHSQCKEHVRRCLHEFFVACDGKAVFAGGAVAQIALADPSEFDASQLADIDMCLFKGYTVHDIHEVAIKMINRMREYSHTIYFPWHEFRSVWTVDRGVTEIQLPFTIKCRPFPVIQLNSANSTARDVSDVLLGFDRAASAFAYNARTMNVLALPRALRAHEDKREFADLVFGSGDSTAAARTGFRDTKYRQRYGIRILTPSWISKMVEVIQQEIANDLIASLKLYDEQLKGLFEGLSIDSDTIGYRSGNSVRLNTAFLKSIEALPGGGRIQDPGDLLYDVYRIAVMSMTELSRECMYGASYAPDGLMTTIMVRFALEDYIDLIFGAKTVHKSVYKPDKVLLDGDEMMELNRFLRYADPLHRRVHENTLDKERLRKVKDDLKSNFLSRKFRRRCNAVRDMPPFTGPILSDLCAWLDILPWITERVKFHTQYLKDKISRSSPWYGWYTWQNSQLSDIVATFDHIK